PGVQVEWELFSVAKDRGADVAGDLDVHHVTERVLGRLRADRHGRSRRMGWAVTGVGGAAEVMRGVWAGRPGQRLGPVSHRPVGVDVAQLPLPELDSLGTPEL